MPSKTKKFFKARIPCGITDLTPQELLLYSVLLENAENNIVSAPVESLIKFIKKPNKLKFTNLEKKGYIKRDKEDNVYKLLKKHKKSICIFSNKYKNTESLLVGLIKTISAKKSKVSVSDIQKYINIDRSTITKKLKNIQGLKCFSVRLNNGLGGKKYYWCFSDDPARTDPYRPEYIVFSKYLTSQFEDLTTKLLFSYYYSLHLMNKEEDLNEVKNLINKDTIDSDIKEKLIAKAVSINEKLPDKPIRIPLYTKYSGIDLCILSLVSDFRLRGHNAIWSLNVFKEYFGINTIEAAFSCKKLIKQKALSKALEKDIESWKTYTGKTSFDFGNAVTVLKPQNIILKYCPTAL